MRICVGSVFNEVFELFICLFVQQAWEKHDTNHALE